MTRTTLGRALTIGALAVATLELPLLTRRPVLSAVLYGCLVFVVMNFVVIPVSAARMMRITWPNLVNGFLGHIIAVGLPCLWVARATAPGGAGAA